MNTDPIADCITRIRNAQKAKHADVLIPFSKVKKELVEVLKTAGFVGTVSVEKAKKGENLRVTLKYNGAEPAITLVDRVSKPGCRVYTSKEELMSRKGKIEISILSTSQGVMTGRQAIEKNVGGEVLCRIA